MSSAYPWVKAFHTAFVASRFAGLFFLPRPFVNLAVLPADSHRWFRVFNEVSLLLFAATLARVVVKPF